MQAPLTAGPQARQAQEEAQRMVAKMRRDREEREAEVRVFDCRAVCIRVRAMWYVCDRS